MSHRREIIARGSRWVFGWAMLLVLGAAGPLAAQDNSLSLVPKDAYFYQSTLRWGEQWQAVVKSKAWAKLNSLPAVKMAWQKVEEEWGNAGGPLSMVRQWYEQDENRQLVQLFTQLAADEVFVFGGRDSIDFVQLLGDVQTSNQFAPLALMLRGGVQAAGNTQDRIGYVLQTLARNPQRIKAPDVVIGFKLADPKLAEKQLRRLDELIQGVPPLNQFVKKTKVGGGNYFTLELDGQMVPWDQLPIRNFEEKQGDFDGLMKRLKNLKVSINLGLRGQYLLMAVGESSAALATLGKGPTLGDHADLKPLAKFSDRRLTSIGYVSKDCKVMLTPTKKDLEESFQSAVDLIKDAGLTPQQEAKLRKELQGLAGEIYRRTPQAGSALAFTFLTERGYEGYSYNRTKNDDLDGSKALTLLEHLGGSPLFFTSMRNRHSPEDYDTVVKVLKLAHSYFEELGLSKLPVDAQQQYQQVMKIAGPLLVRLDKTTGQMLVPALADGQSACLIDAKLASKQWHKDMPASKQPLPILELGLVVGVSDPALLRKAMEEYRGIANDVIAAIRKFAPDADFKIPEPETTKASKGTLYFYPLPEAAGLDKQLQPTAGLGAKVAVVTLSREHASRLLNPTPLTTAEGPLTKTKGPLASATYLDWAGLVQAVTPWVDFGMQQGRAPDDIRDQVRTVLQILQCLRSFSSVTYIEDGAVVSHDETVVRDL